MTAREQYRSALQSKMRPRRTERRTTRRSTPYAGVVSDKAVMARIARCGTITGVKAA